MYAGFEGRKKSAKRRETREGVDDHELPLEDFDRLNARFEFTVDAAANDFNCKLPLYWDKQQNGLLQSWANHRVFCNPPNSRIEPWVRKAWAERSAEISVLLLPANRTDQRWWAELVEPFRDRAGSVLRVEFISKRLKFIQAGEKRVRSNCRPPFGSVLCIWTWGHGPKQDLSQPDLPNID